MTNKNKLMESIIDALFIITFILLVIVVVVALIIQDPALIPFIVGIIAANFVSYLLLRKTNNDEII